MVRQSACSVCWPGVSSWVWCVCRAVCVRPKELGVCTATQAGGRGGGVRRGPWADGEQGKPENEDEWQCKRTTFAACLSLPVGVTWCAGLLAPILTEGSGVRHESLIDGWTRRSRTHRHGAKRPYAVLCTCARPIRHHIHMDGIYTLMHPHSGVLTVPIRTPITPAQPLRNTPTHSCLRPCL